MKKFVLILSCLGLVTLSCNNPFINETNNSDSDEVTAYITGVELTALDKEQIDGITNYFHSDTLKEQIVLEVKTLYRLDGGTLDDFYNAANSTQDQRIPEVTNPLVWGKSWLKFNKDIESDGIIIEADDNILANEKLDERYFFPYAISPFAIHNIRLDKEYFQIPAGMYKIYAAWENVEGKIFEDEIEVYIDTN